MQETNTTQYVASKPEAAALQITLMFENERFSLTSTLTPAPDFHANIKFDFFFKLKNTLYFHAARF